MVVLLATWLSPCLSKEEKQQGADRVVSTVHAIVGGIAGTLLELLTVPACVVEDSVLAWPMCIIIVYLAVDLCSMLVCDVWQGWRKIDQGMIFHHVSAA